MSAEEYQGRHEAPAADAETRAAEARAEAAVAADEETGTPPGISPRTRSTIYIVALAIDLATLLVCGLGVIFGFMTVEQAAQTSALVFVVLGVLSNGLAVGYRPTRPGAIR